MKGSGRRGIDLFTAQGVAVVTGGAGQSSGCRPVRLFLFVARGSGYSPPRQDSIQIKIMRCQRAGGFACDRHGVCTERTTGTRTAAVRARMASSLTARVLPAELHYLNGTVIGPGKRL